MSAELTANVFLETLKELEATHHLFQQAVRHYSRCKDLIPLHHTDANAVPKTHSEQERMERRCNLDTAHLLAQPDSQWLSLHDLISSPSFHPTVDVHQGNPATICPGIDTPQVPQAYMPSAYESQRAHASEDRGRVVDLTAGGASTSSSFSVDDDSAPTPTVLVTDDEGGASTGKGGKKRELEGEMGENVISGSEPSHSVSSSDSNSTPQRQYPPPAARRGTNVPRLSISLAGRGAWMSGEGTAGETYST